MLHEKKGVDYSEYVFRQGRKANNKEKRRMFIRNIPKRIKGFERIFNEVKNELNPGKVLCLGARTGCEIKAAVNVGFSGSQGIDLHPIGEDVIKGDWHNIPFSADSFENVYTNAVDHCFDVEKLGKEVWRVLKPNGLFFFQLSKKQMLKTKQDKEEYMQKSSNFLFWDTGRDLADGFSQFGFVLVKEWENHKWENFIIRKVKGI